MQVNIVINYFLPHTDIVETIRSQDDYSHTFKIFSIFYLNSFSYKINI